VWWSEVDIPKHAAMLKSGSNARNGAYRDDIEKWVRSNW
jgi:hypothetical protein